MHFVGTPEQVFARVEPYLALGVTDIFMVNYSPICDSRYVESGKAAGERLLKMIRAAGPRRAQSSSTRTTPALPSTSTS